MIGSIRHALTNLVSFGGRDTKAAFWPYALVVIGLLFIATTAIMVPELSRTMQRMQQFAVEHPEQATVTSGPGHYEIRIEGHHPELLPDLRSLVRPMLGVMLIVVCLLAAAVVRRLRDAGRSPLWGLPPLPLLALGFYLMSRTFDEPQFAMTMFLTVFGANLLYLASLVTLVVFLLQGSRGMGEQIGSMLRR